MESCVKIDETKPDGTRIIGFASNVTLEILARTDTFCVNGTFKITPKMWSQTFILGAQIMKDVWVPGACCLLPFA
jgi:hypothetical protein